MKYAIVREDNATEIREDGYPLQDGAIVLTDMQYDQLINGTHTLQNGEIVVNPEPPKLF
jgi:hypothetical protein